LFEFIDTLDALDRARGEHSSQSNALRLMNFPTCKKEDCPKDEQKPEDEK
jgi:hypothetical protein